MTRPLRVLVLTKRRYMSRDLLHDRYGRFRELPLALARSGIQVRGLCLGYRGERVEDVVDADGDAQVRWRSLGLSSLLPGGSYWKAIDHLAAGARPDVVFAGSDVPHLHLGSRVAQRLGLPLVVDLYDNFESYALAKVPGVNAMMRRAVRHAAAATVVSAPLARKVREEYQPHGPVHVLENAVPAGVFHPIDRQQARRALDLPANALLVGTAGALAENRGIDVLYRAFTRLSPANDRLHLALAGPVDPRLPVPGGKRVHYLGMLPSADVPTLLSSLDVSVICNRDSEFGRYCFPQKLYESLACGVPTVVANVGAMADLLAPYPRHLFEWNDEASLARAIESQLASPEPVPLSIPDWQSLGDRLAALLASVARRD